MIIEFERPAARDKYPRHLRRVAVWNDEHEFVVELLTNNFTLAASTITALYMPIEKSRYSSATSSSSCGSRILLAQLAIPWRHKYGSEYDAAFLLA